MACCTNYGRSGPAEGREVYLNGTDKQPLSRPSVMQRTQRHFLTTKSAQQLHPYPHFEMQQLFVVCQKNFIQSSSSSFISNPQENNKITLSTNKEVQPMQNKIMIFVCLHDDLESYSKEQIYTGYFSWLKSELEEISEHEVSILLNRRRLPPELSAFNYKGRNESAVLASWKNTAEDWHYKRIRADNYDPRTTKTLLLTRHNINNSVAGIAYQGGSFGIASIKSYRAPAHEIGHMFHAMHEDSAVEYDGWWHDSIMLVDNFSHLRGNTYRFSERNRENMRRYFKSLR